jgi:hypothetical protein
MPLEKDSKYSSASQEERGKVSGEVTHAFMVFYYDKDIKKAADILLKVFMEHIEASWHEAIIKQVAQLKRAHDQPPVAFPSYSTEILMLVDMIREAIKVKRQPYTLFTMPKAPADSAQDVEKGKYWMQVAMIYYFESKDIEETLSYLINIPTHLISTREKTLLDTVSEFCRTYKVSQEHEDDFYKIYRFYKDEIYPLQKSRGEAKELTERMGKILDELKRALRNKRDKHTCMQQ